LPVNVEIKYEVWNVTHIRLQCLNLQSVKMSGENITRNHSVHCHKPLFSCPSANCGTDFN
jgi:hypothetical protein